MNINKSQTTNPFSTNQLEILHKVYYLSMTKPFPVLTSKIQNVENKILNKQIFYQGNEHSYEFGLHIRYRIDLFNYISLILASDRHQFSILYLPLNHEDDNQHYFVLCCLEILADQGYNVYLPYCWGESSKKLLHKELITSTLDGIAKYHLNRLRNTLIFQSFTRFLYSQGKSKSTYESISSEMRYDKIIYSHDHEILGLKKHNLKMSKMLHTKDLLSESFSSFLRSRIVHRYVIGWFPSIKDCAVITPILVSSLLSILYKSSVTVLVGIHPSLKNRCPELYANLYPLYSTDHQNLYYTEFADSYLMISMCNTIIGDVGSTLWDSIQFKKKLILMSKEDIVDYDTKLISSKCYREWFLGKQIGRITDISLEQHLNLLLTQQVTEQID